VIGRLHLPLFLLAIAASLAIKVVVHETLQLTEATIDAQVRYIRPENTVLVAPLQQVKVRLRGKSNEIAGLNPFSVEVAVTIRPGEIGLVEIPGERLNVKTPFKCEVLSIEPNHFTLEVEPLERKTVPLRVVLTGEPAAGATHDDPQVRPQEVTVEGPRSRIRPLRDLTVSVSLDGHALTFEETVLLAAQDPLIKPVEPRQVVVHVPMQLPDLEPPPAPRGHPESRE